MQYFCVACARRFAGAELGTCASCGLYGRAAHALERRSLTAPRDVGRDADADAPSRVPLRRRPTAVPRRNDGPRGCHLSSAKNMCYVSYINYLVAWIRSGCSSHSTSSVFSTIIAPAVKQPAAWQVIASSNAATNG